MKQLSKLSLFNFGGNITTPNKRQRKSIWVREGEDRIKLDIISEKALILYKELEKKKNEHIHVIKKSIFSITKVKSTEISKKSIKKLIKINYQLLIIN
mgnify:CR=1 FL=1